jgi:CheY-like chemotaxis protein
VETIQTKRLLVAVKPRSHDTMSRALTPGYSFTLCSSLVTAQWLLNQDFDLIVCGMNFDDSRMFDLLRYVRNHPATRSTPFLCLKLAEGMLQTSVFKSVEKAARLLGADDFIDFARWRREFGDEQAYERLRDLMNRFL